MPFLSEALRFAENPATSDDQLRRACQLLSLDPSGTQDELRARLLAHLKELDSQAPVICLNPKVEAGAKSEPGPTGLQKSMRFLLQIISGVLLADLVTKSVSIAGLKPSASNVVICIAAGAFLFRIFVDNLLYYEATDKPVTSTREYLTRLFLLVLDLASYVTCYDIVFRIGRYIELSWPTMFRTALIVRVAQDIAVVEGLHSLWALITWAMLRTWHTGEDRKPFATWAFLSAGTACLMGILSPIIDSSSGGLDVALLAIGSGISLMGYVWFRRAQYMRVVA